MPNGPRTICRMAEFEWDAYMQAGRALHVDFVLKEDVDLYKVRIAPWQREIINACIYVLELEEKKAAKLLDSGNKTP